MSHRQKVWTSARSLQDQLPWGDFRPLDVLDKRDLCLPLPASPLLRVRGHLLPETNATIEGVGMWHRSCTSLKTLSYSSSDFFVIIICSDRYCIEIGERGMGPWEKYYNIVHIGRFCRGICGLFERASIECGKWDLFGEVKKGWVWKREKFQRERNGFPLHVCTTLPACYLLMASRHRSWRGYLPRFVSSTSGSDAAASQWLISLLMIGNLFKRQKYFLGQKFGKAQKYATRGQQIYECQLFVSDSTMPSGMF